MRIVYRGEAPSRTIEVPGGQIVIEHGVPTQVPDDIAEQLLEQDIFTPAQAKPKQESD